MKTTIDEPTARAIYDILIEECRANPEEYDRWGFARSQAEGCSEWRFCGVLGFGGKFRVNPWKWYVDCYPEDETPERKAMISAANARLDALHETWVAAQTKEVTDHA